MVSAQLAMSQLTTARTAVLTAGPSRPTVAFAAPTPRALVSTGRRAGRLGHVGSSYRRKVTVCGLFGLGVPEIAVIAGVAALIWGPSKLPELGKGLGKSVKGFQTAAKEFNEELAKASAAEAKTEEENKDATAAAAKDAAPKKEGEGVTPK